MNDQRSGGCLFGFACVWTRFVSGVVGLVVVVKTTFALGGWDQWPGLVAGLQRPSG